MPPKCNNPCCFISTHTGCLTIGCFELVVAILMIGGSAWFFNNGVTDMEEMMACTPSKAIAFDGDQERHAKECEEMRVDQSHSQRKGVALLVNGIISLVPAVSLLYGTYRKRPGFLLPFIIVEVIASIILNVLAIAFLMSPGVASVLLSVSSLGLGIYEVIVVFYHYTHLHRQPITLRDLVMSELERLDA